MRGSSGVKRKFYAPFLEGLVGVIPPGYSAQITTVVWLKYCDTVRKLDGQLGIQTSTCSNRRTLSTRQNFEPYYNLGLAKMLCPNYCTQNCLFAIFATEPEPLSPRRIQRIRFAEIDCPEHNQAFGEKAKKFTSNMAFGKDVTMKVRDIDRYGRTVGEIILPDNRSLNRELVSAGLAWWYRQYSNDQSIGKLEPDAKAMHKGLWSDANPIAPWDFRHHR